MADKTITALTAAGALDGTELLAIVQASNSRKLTVLALSTAVLGAAVLPGTTVTTSNPLIDHTQTWNAGAVTFTAWKLNVTATAAAAASLLVDLQKASTSQWKVDNTGKTTQLGALVLPAGTVAAPAFQIGELSGFVRVGAGNISLAVAGTELCRYSAGAQNFGGYYPIAWYTGGAFAAVGVALTPPSAGIMRLSGATTSVGAGLQFVEMTAPTAPATNNCILFSEDNGAGKTRLVVRFPTGADAVLATEV